MESDDELESDLDDSEEEEEVKVPPTKKVMDDPEIFKHVKLSFFDILRCTCMCMYFCFQGKKPQPGNKKAQPVSPAPAAASKKEKPKGTKNTSLTPQPTKNSKLAAGKTPLSSVSQYSKFSIFIYFFLIHIRNMFPCDVESLS